VITIALLSCVKKVATMGSEKKVMRVMKALKVKEKTMKAMKAWKEKNNTNKKKKMKKKKKKQDEEMKKRKGLNSVFACIKKKTVQLTLLTNKGECARAAFRKWAKGGKATAMRSCKDLENVWELNRRAMHDAQIRGRRRPWTWKTWKKDLEKGSGTTRTWEKDLGWICTTFWEKKVTKKDLVHLLENISANATPGSQQKYLMTEAYLRAGEAKADDNDDPIHKVFTAEFSHSDFSVGSALSSEPIFCTVDNKAQCELTHIQEHFQNAASDTLGRMPPAATHLWKIGCNVHCVGWTLVAGPRHCYFRKNDEGRCIFAIVPSQPSCQVQFHELVPQKLDHQEQAIMQLKEQQPHGMQNFRNREEEEEEQEEEPQDPRCKRCTNMKKEEQAPDEQDEREVKAEKEKQEQIERDLFAEWKEEYMATEPDIIDVVLTDKKLMEKEEGWAHDEREEQEDMKVENHHTPTHSAEDARFVLSFEDPVTITDYTTRKVILWLPRPQTEARVADALAAIWGVSLSRINLRLRSGGHFYCCCAPEGELSYKTLKRLFPTLDKAADIGAHDLHSDMCAGELSGKPISFVAEHLGRFLGYTNEGKKLVCRLSDSRLVLWRVLGKKFDYAGDKEDRQRLWRYGFEVEEAFLGLPVLKASGFPPRT
jgi:hypothetical protein